MGRQQARVLLTAAAPEIARYFRWHFEKEAHDPQLVDAAYHWASWQAVEELEKIAAAYPAALMTVWQFDLHRQRVLARTLSYWRNRLSARDVPEFTMRALADSHLERSCLVQEVVTLFLLGKKAGET